MANVKASRKGRIHSRIKVPREGGASGLKYGKRGRIGNNGVMSGAGGGGRKRGSELHEAAAAPVWTTIPDETVASADLEQFYNVAYATSNSGPIVYTLVTPPAGFSVTKYGVMHIAEGTAAAAHSITVNAANASGNTDSAAFTYTITA